MFAVFIWAILGWGGNAVLLCALGEHRIEGRKLAKFWAVTVLINAIVTCIIYQTAEHDKFLFLAIIASMILQLAPYICTTRGNIGKRVFFALNSTCVIALIGVFSIKIFPPISMVGNLIKVAICLGLAYLYLKFVRTPLEETIRNTDNHWLWLNLTGTLFSALFYWAIINYAKGKILSSTLLLIMILTIVVYVGLFYILHYMSSAITLTQIRLQEETLLGQIKSLIDMEQQASIMRHDLRHHNQAIMAFVRQKQYSELLSYLSKYDESMAKESHPNFCDNPLVNNILGVYNTKANEARIKFSPQASLSADCNIDQRDLLGLVSNILENALNGCEKEGEITLKLFDQDKKLIVLCENTAKTPILFKNGIPQNKNRKSSGISSILRTVNHYDGMADFSQSQDIFTAHIILNLA